MKLPRRKFLHLAAGAAALPTLSGFASAQTYPTRPVRLIVGFAAGGGADIVARLIGQWLSERLGQQFIIENRPGAGSNIATEAVVRAAADGYTLLLVTVANAFNATLYDKLNFNFIRDIAPVAGSVSLGNKTALRLYRQDLRVDGVAHIDQQQRLSVRRRPHDRFSGDVASRAGPVLDDELLAEPLRQLLSDQTTHGVGRAARRVAYDDPHWS